jgi:hypothetical protein
MLTSKRTGNKSTFLRKVFLWSNIVVSLSYTAVLIIGRVTYEYTEVKEMM